MVEEWYCEIAGREVGPLTAQQLRAMAIKGQILPSDCVRPASQTQWVLARQIRGLFPIPAPLQGPPNAAGHPEHGDGSPVAPPAATSSTSDAAGSRRPPLPVAERILEPSIAPEAPPVAARAMPESRIKPPPLVMPPDAGQEAPFVPGI